MVLLIILHKRIACWQYVDIKDFVLFSYIYIYIYIYIYFFFYIFGVKYIVLMSFLQDLKPSLKLS